MSASDPFQSIHVAVGVLQRADGRVLLGQRPAGGHLPGLWEFPGGKIEAGETPLQCLQRELWEEIGIRLQTCRPLIRLHHTYAQRQVHLHVFEVSQWSGQITGREGQAIQWASQAELRRLELPAADLPVLTALQLAKLYAITPPDLTDANALLTGLNGLLQRGIRQIQLRLDSPRLSTDEALLADCVAQCHQAGASLMLNADIQRAGKLGCGLHLKAAQLKGLSARPIAVDQWLGASCHSVEEVARAEQLGVDFAVLSPVKNTQSHPHAQPIGWRQFEHWVTSANLPVYALGGLTPGDLDIARQHGAQGVAAIRSIWPG
jgi:8-oxo-dGTP diphosphatase